MRVSTLALAILGLAAASAKAAPSATITFEDGMDDGYGLKFSNDASANFPIVNVNGSNYMQVARTGAFQEADNGTGNTSSDLFQALAAAAANPAGYDLSYDWYVDTSQSAATPGNFLQLGSYINSGSGAYAQDFGAVKEVELNGTQLASGQVFKGHVDVNFAAAGLIVPAGDTFYRIGIIENGDGANLVDFDNISIHPIPEPATIALLGMAVPALAMRRRRRA